MGTRIEIADLGLPPAALNWVGRLSKHHGNEVLIEEDPAAEHIGEATSYNRAPHITVNSEGNNAVTISHELCHLILEIEGWPQWTVIYQADTKEKAEAIVGSLSPLADQLQSMIEHHSFYPWLKEIELDPLDRADQELVKADFLGWLKQQKAQDVGAKLDMLARELALRIARVQLEATPGMVSQVLDSVSHLQLSKQLSDEIVEIISASPMTSDGACEAMKKCWVKLGLPISSLKNDA